MTKKLRFFITIILGGILLLFSSCEKDQSPVLPSNNIPIIDSILASKIKVLINTEIRLVCFANDKDGDSLNYSWTSRRGNFSKQIGNSIVWKSPQTIGTDTIKVIVTDGKAFAEKIIVIFVGQLPKIPRIIAPLDKQTEIELKTKLLWEKLSGATNYTLQLSLEDSFNKLLVNKRQKSNSFILDGLHINTNYYWRIKATNDFGSSSWSKIYSFRTVAPPLPPILVYPANLSNKVEPNIKFSWEKIKNASEYILHVAEDDSFNKIVSEFSNLTDTTIQSPYLEHFGSYYWRVKARNKYGESEWSCMNMFTIVGTTPKQTSLIHPENNSYNNELTAQLTWAKVLHANEYKLEVAEDSLFTKIFATKTKLVDSEFRIENLKNYTKYFWRVKSSNDYGNAAWSSTYSFITKIAAPVVTSADIIENGRPLSPELIWNEVNGAESYSLQVAADSAFSNIVFSDTSIELSKRKVSGLLDYTNYYWRVAANNKFGNSSWSATQPFKTTGFYYQGLPYGNQSIYNPAYVILTGGFGMIQFGDQRDIKNFPFGTAFKNIWENFKDPFTPIGHYGWWNFFKDQVFPLSLNKQSAQFWPNYSLHLIGGGMAYAQTREWFKYHNYPYPSWLSAFTIMTYHFFNEVVENGSRVGEDVDPIADFYLFDIGGIVLFSSESVKRFFAEDLNLSDWSQQPSFSLRNGELHNNDQFFSVKWKFPFSDSWHAFYYFGTNGVGGLSYKFKNGSAISVGAGLAASDLIVLDEKTNKKTLGLVGNFAAFYDRNNSLLASLAVTIKTDYMVNINIYPGLVKLWGFSPGLWAAYSQNGNYIFGITATWLPIGFAYSTK